jgi:hypothetical protein
MKKEYSLIIKILTNTLEEYRTINIREGRN